MKYIVGLDGGGTSTVLQGITLEGKGLFRETFGAMNLNSNEQSVVEATIASIRDYLKAQEGGLEACQIICLGSAGVSNPDTVVALKNLFGTVFPRIPFVLVDDAEVALYGALGQPVGCIVISGTGSISMGQNQKGEIHRAGGWGYLVDDLGSGYYIGREILSAVFKSYDYRAPVTALTPLVWELLGLNTIPDLIAYIYDPARQKRDIAILAPLLDQALEKGDKVAEKIKVQSVKELTALAAATIDRLGLQREKISFLGGVLQKSMRIRTGVLEALKEKYPALTYTDPVHDAAWGACLLAQDHLRKKG